MMEFWHGQMSEGYSLPYSSFPCSSSSIPFPQFFLESKVFLAQKLPTKAVKSRFEPPDGLVSVVA
jgi:hypothetical protein